MHGQFDRWGFLDRAAKFAVGGVTVASHLDSLKPNYALAQKVAKPAGESKAPGVLVIHENRGHTPYIEDIARRVGTSGFIALAPDILAPLDGYPETDDEGRVMQRQLDQGKMTEDFIAAARYLKAHPRCSGKVGLSDSALEGAGRTRWRQGFRT